MSALYAHVNKRQQQDPTTSDIDLDRVTLGGNGRGAASQLRSITEIYQSTDRQPNDGDNESVSTLEGTASMANCPLVLAYAHPFRQTLSH